MGSAFTFFKFPSNSQNVFAKIIRGEIPADKVYENEHALAFRDLHPKAPVHILVIPKGEYVNLLDFTENASAPEQSAFWDAIKSVSGDLSAYRCLSNTGAPYQEVFHFHMHIMADKCNK